MNTSKEPSQQCRKDNIITIWDEQDGKYVTGLINEVYEHFFILEVSGEMRRFDIALLNKNT